MKIIYKGRYSGDPDSLPSRPHRPGAVKFREMSDTKTFGLWANAAAIILMAALAAPVFVMYGRGLLETPLFLLACLSPLVIMFPHEMLHAICFREEAYIYTNFQQGMLFVFGPEDMSRGRFVFLSLLPNIVFGFVPYIAGLTVPSAGWLGIAGAFCIGCGAGDYYNVFNALTQVPKGGLIYMYGFNSWWYMP